MKTFRHIHFVGIGGIGMSSIAQVLLRMGYTVSGSDVRASRITDRLEALGAKVYIGHDEANVKGATALVISSAIGPDNPELEASKATGLPLLQRAEMLGWIMKDRIGIAIAGTHGKTTTTSMVAQVLHYNRLDPTVIVGGELRDADSNALFGQGPHLVAEADESDASFLSLNPRIAVVTNIDSDINLNAPPFALLNFSYRKTMRKVMESFRLFLAKIPRNGRAILCVDDPNVRKIIPDVKRPIITYGLDHQANLMAVDVELENFCSQARIVHRGKELGYLKMNAPGRHNVQNALAAIAVGLEAGLPFENIVLALLTFDGVARRFHIYGEPGGVLIVDDYAHNPSKVRAALHAARTGWNKRVIAVFQPHRYTRTKFLLEEFSRSFDDADLLLVTDIYSAGEVPIVGVKGEALADAVRGRKSGPRVIFLSNQRDIVEYLLKITVPGDLVITLGAGNINQVAEELLKRLAAGLSRAA
jgi:UDP-N-acetylmuramate--alanine ligase